MTKNIILTDGKVAVVDDDVFDRLGAYRWVWDGRYVVRYERLAPKKYQKIRLHREVNETPDGVETDHVDRDRLNNVRANLRDATHMQNMWNKPAYKTSKSGAKGVYWCPRTSRWRAEIRARGRRERLGYFLEISDAKKAYAAAARRLHGEFARSA